MDAPAASSAQYSWVLTPAVSAVWAPSFLQQWLWEESNTCSSTAIWNWAHSISLLFLLPQSWQCHPELLMTVSSAVTSLWEPQSSFFFYSSVLFIYLFFATIFVTFITNVLIQSFEITSYFHFPNWTWVDTAMCDTPMSCS